MKRKRSLAAIALLLSSTSAFAADLPSRRAPPVFAPPPIPVFTWTGFYIGGQVGYAFGQDGHFVPTEGARFTGTDHGVIGGGHAGYNFSTQSVPVLGQVAGALGGLPVIGGYGGAGGVVGIEGDVDGSSYRGAVQNPITTTIVHTDIPIQGSIRGRVGIAIDRALFFATGGVAIGEIQHNYFAPTGVVYPFAPTRVGFTVGGGVEYAITNDFSLRAEYRYTDFGDRSDLVAGFVPVYGHTIEQMARGGFSFKIDAGGPAPVVARY